MPDAKDIEKVHPVVDELRRALTELPYKQPSRELAFDDKWLQQTSIKIIAELESLGWSNGS